MTTPYFDIIYIANCVCVCDVYELLEAGGPGGPGWPFGPGGPWGPMTPGAPAWPFVPCANQEKSQY